MFWAGQDTPARRRPADRPVFSARVAPTIARAFGRNRPRRGFAIAKPRAQHRKNPARRRNRPGSSPGLLITDPTASPTQVRVFHFAADHLEEFADPRAAKLRELIARPGTVWLDVAGMGDGARIAEIGEIFGLHRLALEDVLSGHQRPKVDPYPTALFIVARMPERRDTRLDTDQLSMFLGERFLVTFQSLPGDCFDPVRERLRKPDGRMRTLGPDYLAYALLDATIDSYFPVLEALGERLEELEDEVLREPGRNTIPRIHAVRRDLLTLRRATWPQREAINALQRESSPWIRPETRPYLNDCYDHTIQTMDLLESYRELGGSLLEVWLSSASNRMGEAMRFLTVISTIFIPLTFIVGLYGMNFDHMPELRWPYGYYVCLAALFLIAAALIAWFWRKGWFRDTRPAPPSDGKETSP